MNYDIIGTVKLPIFLESSIGRSSEASWLTTLSKPYKVIEVPIYEYSGNTADFDVTKCNGYLLIWETLVNVTNVTGENAYIFMLENYAEYEENGILPLGAYSLGSYQNDGIYWLMLGCKAGNIGSYVRGFPSYTVIFKSPSSGRYWMANYLKSAQDGFTTMVAGSTFKTGLESICDYEGDAVNPFYPEDPYRPGGTSGPGGGNGDFGGGHVSEDITGMLPNGSSESNSSSTGLFTRYAVNNAELKSVGFALYAENILAQATKAVMSFLWNSPSEALISLISYPFDVTSLLSTTPSSVKFGAIDLEAVTASRLNGTFAQIDWGTIKLSEYWGNFLDYAPHTKIELYLPWCTGSVSIDPHEVLPGSISVKTNIEISKGTCVHNVFGNKGALIGTYSGTCGSQLPMTALDSSGKALALVTAAAGALVAGAAAGGGASAGIAAANSPHTTAMAYSLENSRGLDPMAARVIAQREAIAMAESPYRAIERRAAQAALVSSVAAFRTPATIQRNGSFTGNGAGMAIQFPFVIVSRPEQNIPKNYGHFFGYPSNVYTTIGSVSGYTEIGSIHVNGLTGATLDEVEEVERLLKGGVIL